MKDTVKIQVLLQGDAVVSEEGYMEVQAENIVAFYVDGWGKTSRIYPICTSQSSFIDGKQVDYPSMTIEDGEEDTALTDICFPEYEGWRIHSAFGGKTMAVCLVKD